MGLLQAVQCPFGLVLTPCLLISDCKVPSIESNWSTPLPGPVGDRPTLLGLAYWASDDLTGWVCYTDGQRTKNIYLQSNTSAKRQRVKSVVRQNTRAISERSGCCHGKRQSQKCPGIFRCGNGGKSPNFFFLVGLQVDWKGKAGGIGRVGGGDKPQIKGCCPTYAPLEKYDGAILSCGVGGLTGGWRR